MYMKKAYVTYWDFKLFLYIYDENWRLEYFQQKWEKSRDKRAWHVGRGVQQDRRSGLGRGEVGWQKMKLGRRAGARICRALWNKWRNEDLMPAVERTSQECYKQRSDMMRSTTWHFMKTTTMAVTSHLLNNYLWHLPSSLLMEPKFSSIIGGPMLLGRPSPRDDPLLVSGLGKTKAHNSEQLDLMDCLLGGIWEPFLTLTKWTQDRNTSGFCLYRWLAVEVRPRLLQSFWPLGERQKGKMRKVGHC